MSAFQSRIRGFQLPDGQGTLYAYRNMKYRSFYILSSYTRNKKNGKEFRYSSVKYQPPCHLCGKILKHYIVILWQMQYSNPISKIIFLNCLVSVTFRRLSDFKCRGIFRDWLPYRKFRCFTIICTLYCKSFISVYTAYLFKNSWQYIKKGIFYKWGLTIIWYYFLSAAKRNGPSWRISGFVKY